MNTIFYFTGTGNCLQVASLLGKKLPGETRLIRVWSGMPDMTDEVFSGRVGIVYPVYSNNMPIMLKSFLEQIRVDTSPETYIFTVLVHGGMPGRVHVYLESVFKRKGARVSGAFTVRLPHNGIVLFNAEPEEKQTIWFSGLDARVQEIADAVLAETIVTCGDTMPGFRAMQKLGMKPPPGGFRMSDEQEAPNFLFDPARREKEFAADERCIGCGICVRVCPAANITLKNGKPVWNGRCESCMACIQWCPRQSIQCGDATIGRTRYHNPNISLQDIVL